MRTFTRCVGIAGLAAAIQLGTPLDASAGRPNFCRKTAKTVQQACLSNALSDSQIQLANCENLPDAKARKACRREAGAVAKEARPDCQEALASRQDACEKLGAAPYAPLIDPTNFSATIDNPYFPLKPGTTFVYEGMSAGGLERVDFIVTHNTKVILGVTCVEVHDVVRLDGEVTEDTLDWFAQDDLGNVWYFGENTGEYEDGRVVNIDGTFTAGIDEAKPGIIMEAAPAVGDFYRQEFSLDNAEDNAEVVGLNEPISVPFGSFANCLKTEETTPLEPDALENKYYAPGVGNVATVDLVTGMRSELKQVITTP